MLLSWRRPRRTGDPAAPETGAAPARRPRRRAGLRLVVIALAAGALLAPAGAASSAAAPAKLPLCPAEEAPWPERPGTVYESETISQHLNVPTGGSHVPDEFVRFQSAGMPWHIIKTTDCLEESRDGMWEAIYSPTWNAAKQLNQLSITAYFMASTDLLPEFEDSIVTAIEGLRDGVWSPLISSAIILGAVWMGYQGLIARRATVSAQGALWMVVAIAAGSWLMFSPSSLISASTALTTGGAQLVNQSVGGMRGGTVPCTSSLVEQYGSESDAQFAARSNATMLWSGLSCKPWTHGLFGADRAEELSKAHAGTVMEASAFDIHLLQDENGEPLTGAPVSEDGNLNYQEQVEQKQKQFTKVATKLEEEEPDAYRMFSGAQGPERVSIAVMAFAVALVGGGLILVASIALLALKMAMVIGMMVLPIVGLIGIHPGYGRRLALGWCEWMIGLIIKQAMVLVMVGLLVLILGTILTSGATLMSQLIMLAALLVGLLMAWSPLWRMLTTHGSGAGRLTGDEPLRAPESLRRAGSTMAYRMRSRGRSGGMRRGAGEMGRRWGLDDTGKEKKSRAKGLKQDAAEHALRRREDGAGPDSGGSGADGLSDTEAGALKRRGKVDERVRKAVEERQSQQPPPLSGDRRAGVWERVRRGAGAPRPGSATPSTPSNTETSTRSEPASSSGSSSGGASASGTSSSGTGGSGRSASTGRPAGSGGGALQRREPASRRREQDAPPANPRPTPESKPHPQRRDYR